MVSSKFLVSIAPKRMTTSIVGLCERLLSEDNDALYSSEFLCPVGLRSSINKGFVICAMKNGGLAGALRFYPSRRVKQVSLYQFVVAEHYRGQGVVTEMIHFLHTQFEGIVVCKCPKQSSFNNYFIKTGWTKNNISEDVYSIWEWRWG
jgi:hypothetical protein